MVVARNERSLQALARQFERRQVDKRYLAIAYGRLLCSPLDVDAPIGRHPRIRTRMTVSAAGRRAQNALRRASLSPRSLGFPARCSPLHGSNPSDPSTPQSREAPARRRSHVWRKSLALSSDGLSSGAEGLPPACSSCVGAVLRPPQQSTAATLPSRCSRRSPNSLAPARRQRAQPSPRRQRGRLPMSSAALLQHVR